MKALRLLTLSVCLLIGGAPALLPANTDKSVGAPPDLREFEAFVEKQMKDARIPGLSVAVMKGDFVWSKGFGFADLENRVPATPESSYRLASVTKPMTAVAALKLVEEGKLDLDAEVQKYVPSFPKKPWPITVRQLLGHLGGITHYRDLAKEAHFKEPKNTAEAVAVFREFDLVAEPGTRYSYTTYGYVLLGAIIESAAGKSYTQVLREKVWEPLGMSATRVDDMRAIIPNRVRGYEIADGKLRHSEYVDVSSRFAGGGTRSTVVDMIAFVRGLAAGKVLRPETLDMMWTAQTTRDGRPTSYGLGWDVAPVSGRFRVAHDGSQPETETYLLYLPRENFAIALATNLEDAGLNVFANQLVKMFLGDDWTARPWLRGAEHDVAGGLAILRAYNQGLAYYDRHGRAMTSDAKELDDAFAALNASFEGKQMTREQWIRAGSHVAKTLAPRGLDKYHHEGAFAFFSDYAGTPRLSAKAKQRIAALQADWTRTAAIRDAAELVRAAPTLMTATVIPDFSGQLVAKAQQTAMRGDIAGALGMANVAVSLYPGSDGANGLAGVLQIISGDVATGEQSVRKSAAINRNGFFGPENVLRVVAFLANTPMRPAAIKVLAIARQIHPDDVAIAKTMETLAK